MQKAVAYAALSLAALLEVQGENSGAFVFRHALFKIAFPGFALGIALFLSAADGHWPRLYCVGSGMPIGSSLTSGFGAVHQSWAAVL
jgi:hypothetical protein